MHMIICIVELYILTLLQSSGASKGSSKVAKQAGLYTTLEKAASGSELITVIAAPILFNN